MICAIVLLGYTTLERAGELFLARRNTAALLRRGGVERSPGHFPFIAALHTVWLAGLWVLGWDRPLHPGWLSVFAVLQILRFWVMASLGPRWTTRIIVLPGAPLVTRGPYRFVRHPNYAVVVGEIAVLPLVFGLPWYALAFSILNGIALAIRIPAEAAALREDRDVGAR